MRALISVVFGSRNDRIGWISEEELPELPHVGMPVVINVAGNTGPVEGQVYRAWEDDADEPGGMLIYGGPAIPDETFQQGIEFAGWERLTSEALKVLSDAVDDTPVLAATHEVVLLVGEPGTPDFTAYSRVLNPSDPVLPLFGQRVRLMAIDNGTEDDEDDMSDEEWDTYRAQELARIESQLDGEADSPSVEDGVPSVTLYSALVRTGIGRVAFWSPSLFGLTPADLIAHDWNMLIIPDEFNPDEFRAAERIRLARETTLTFVSTDTGVVKVDDWFMREPLKVTEDQHPLLPPMLVEHVRASREFQDFSSILDEWKNS